MPLYDETELNDADGMEESVLALNNLSNGWLGIGIVVVLYLVILYWLSKDGADIKSTAFATALIMMVLGLLFLAIGLITKTVVGIQIAILVATIVATLWRRD